MKTIDRKSAAFIIYMGSRRAIYNDIAASTSVIFRPRQKNSLGQCGARGPNGEILYLLEMTGLKPMGLIEKKVGALKITCG